MRNRSFLAAVVALFLIGLAGAIGLADNPAPTPAAQVESTSAVVWSHGRDGGLRNAEEHWEKHGAEFPQFRGAQDYEHAALAFVRHPPTGTLVKHRGNGDTLYYDPAQNIFAVADGEGEPRTFFKPDSGHAYWDRP